MSITAEAIESSIKKSEGKNGTEIYKINLSWDRAKTEPADYAKKYCDAKHIADKQTYQKSFLIVGFLSLSPFGRHKKIPLIPFVKKYEGKSDFMSDYSASASLFFLLFLRLALLFALASSIFAAFSAS